jgi:hypothetical protein
MTAINPNYVPANFYDTQGNLTVDSTYAQQVSDKVAEKIAQMPSAQRDLFLSMLHTADLSPAGNRPEDVNAALERLDGALSNVANATTTVLAALALLMEVGTQAVDLLAKTMIEQAAQQRKDALASRLEAREQAKNQLLDQAGKMKEAAEKELSGALTAMITAIVIAVVTIAISTLSIAKAGSSMDKVAKAGDMPKNPDGTLSAEATMLTSAAGAQQQSATAWSSLSQALGGLGQGIGGYMKATADADAKKTEADGQIHAANAQYEQGQADIKKEIQDAVNDLIKSIIQFLKEIKDAEIQMMQAITRG